MSTALPKVACVCPTYGRFGESHDHTIVIAEAVESFLRQTYPNKSLILINDTPNQKIVCNARGVTVINSSERYSSIGFKRNAAIQAATDADIIFVWDDDDISLPCRIANGVLSLTRSDASYMGERNVWVSRGNENYYHDRPGGQGLTASAYYWRDDVLRIPYQDKSFGEDHALYADLMAAGLPVGHASRAPHDIGLIYRWDYLVRHVSAYGDGDGYEVLGQETYPAATLSIQPQWQYDYAAKCKELADLELAVH